MSNCYHCHLPVPAGIDLSVELLGETRPMCCLGCQAVAESIRDNGLTDYYKYRTESAEQAQEAETDILDQLKYLDFPDIQKDFVKSSGEQKEITLSIEGITCSACSWLIEKQLISLHGIIRVNVNSSTHRAMISWNDSQLKLTDIIRKIQQVGYKAFPFQSDNQEQIHKQQLKSMLVKIGVSGLMTMQVMMFAFALYFGFVGGIDATTQMYFHWVSMALTLPVVTYCSTPFFSSAFRSLKNGGLNMDVSVSLAIVVIFGASAWATVTDNGKVYFESVAMFIFLLLVGRYMELKARAKATEVSANMLKLLPLVAHKKDQDGISTIPAKHLQVGDVIVIQPGETIAADGVIVEGKSSVNQSMLSGESDAVAKQTGDQVYAGTINMESPVSIQIDKPQQDNLVNTIIRLQDEANAHKPRVAAIADTVAKWFVLVVIMVACLSAAYWYQSSPHQALQVFVAILVATCPCALSLATPVALTCAISRLNTSGILIRKANVLQTINDLTRFAFDKTGTLTQGDISVAEIIRMDGKSNDALMQIAASLEQHSEHPIARAFANSDIQAVAELKNTPGQGVSGLINGVSYKLGKPGFVGITQDIETDKQGDIYLSENNTLIAAFRLEDHIRTEVPALIEHLLADQACSILSGDNKQKVTQVADKLNIADYHSGLTPEDKLNHITQWQQQGETVAMVGDGINDAPVLAAANVSFAVSEASDLSKQGADVILLNQDLNAIKQAVIMAKQSQRVINQNFAWAIGYNSLALPLAFFGILAPWMAVIGMSASSILVLSNSKRLNRLEL